MRIFMFGFTGFRNSHLLIYKVNQVSIQTGLGTYLRFRNFPTFLCKFEIFFNKIQKVIQHSHFLKSNFHKNKLNRWLLSFLSKRSDLKLMLH